MSGMEIGKVPERVLKRAVLAQLHGRRDEVLLGAGVGEDCAALRIAGDEAFVLSADPVTVALSDIGRLGVHAALNDLASSGAEPVGVLLTLLLPEGSSETELREVIRQAESACEGAGAQVLGGHAEVTGAVCRPLLTVCGVGKAKAGKLIPTGGARPGDDIIATKWAGLEGTSILAKEKEQELLTRYPAFLVGEAKRFDRYLSVIPEGRIAAESGAHAMHDAAEGGIFGALWEMAASSKVGLEIDLKKIPIRQETVEVCEFFGLNPYGLVSGGCMLVAARDGNGLLRELGQAGIPAAVIGKAREGNDRVLWNGDEKRFLEPPKPDEIHKVI